jgi:arsenate reductase
VLFLCIHNAGRSQMAAGFARALAGERLEVRPAGSTPADRSNPVAVQAMAKADIHIADQAPQQLTYQMVEVSDVRVMMGCGDACPVLPDTVYRDWAATRSGRQGHRGGADDPRRGPRARTSPRHRAAAGHLRRGPVSLPDGVTTVVAGPAHRWLGGPLGAGIAAVRIAAPSGAISEWLPVIPTLGPRLAPVDGRRPWFLPGAAALLAAAVVFAPAEHVNPDTFGAWAAGIQVVLVTASLLFAYQALRADNHDRRVDRVLALHNELTIGDVNEGRSRLARHLRTHGPGEERPTRASKAQLESDPVLSHYGRRPRVARLPTGLRIRHFEGPAPATDLARILRTFERARSVQMANSAFDPLMADLLGRHAVWWDEAIVFDDRATRLALREFANWSTDYARMHRQKYSYLEGWFTYVSSDFGRPTNPTSVWDF